MAPKTILSLFDYSGQWSRPFEEAGHIVIPIDIKLDSYLHDVANFDVAHFIERLGIEEVDAIISALPCTHLASSGARHWKAKDADGRTAAAVHLANQVLRCVDYWKPDWWVNENPVGRLGKIVPGFTTQTPFRFDPCDYAGSLDAEISAADLERLTDMQSWHATGKQFSQSDIDLIKASNRYNKRTCLWGSFNKAELAAAMTPRAAIKVCDQGSWLQRLGGVGEATKAARSETPLGFSRAFYQAHEWTPENVHRWQVRRALNDALYFLEGDDTPATADSIAAVFEQEDFPDITAEDVRQAFIAGA